jgi:cellobiose phosphorylase
MEPCFYMFSSKSGQFSNDGREYIITDRFTFRPWENYLYTHDGKFHTIITQRGKGSSFFDCPEVNNVSNGRNYCLLEVGTDKCWSVNGGDGTVDSTSYKCIHSPGKTAFETSYEGIEAKLECVLAIDRHIEADKLTICNTSSKTRKFSLIGYHMISLKGIDNRLECQRTQYIEAASAICAERRHYRTPKHNYSLFFKADRRADTYCGSLLDFLGGDRSFSESRSLKSGKLSNTMAYGTEPIAALQYDLILEPGEKIQINFALGLAQDIEKAGELASEYECTKANDEIFAGNEAFYNEFIGEDFISTPDDVLNTMLNVWTKCQLHRQTISARSTPWFNWRNHLQDAWAYLVIDPGRLRHWIECTCRAQHDDGFIPRCSERVPSLKFPDQTHADIATWTALCASRYYAETGDGEFFHQTVNYGKAKDKSATIFESIVNGLMWLFDHKGPNGMVLMRDGDWSDPLEEVGKRDIGESPWTSMALINAAKNFAPVLSKEGMGENASKLISLADELTAKVNEIAWDGDWYIRAITDDGERLCKSDDEDGRVSLLLQSWAVISGVASAERLEKLVKAVDENNKTEIGPILYAPPFLKPRPWIGRETAKPAGTCVNGSCYNHVAVMWAKAEAILGRPEQSIEIIKKVLPLGENDKTPVTKAIPLWIPNYWHGPHSLRAGEGSDVMTSAAPPWIFLVMTDYIFGVRAELDGLKVSPCMPAEWQKARFKRNWRNSRYDFEFIREGDGRGVRLEIDGKKIDGCYIQADETAAEHKVKVYIGVTDKSLSCLIKPAFLSR